VHKSLTPEVGDKFDAGKSFKFSPEEQRIAEGWAKVQLWDASEPHKLGQEERVIKLTPEEQQKAQEWAKVQLWENPEIKQETGKPFTSLEEQRARGWEKVQLWNANKPQTPEFKDVDLSSKEKRGSDKTVKDRDQTKDKGVTDNQQNKPGILAGFRHGIEKVKHLFRSKSADATEGPKELTPLDPAPLEGPVVKDQEDYCNKEKTTVTETHTK